MRNKRLARLAYAVLTYSWGALVVFNLLFACVVALPDRFTPEVLVTTVETARQYRYLLAVSLALQFFTGGVRIAFAKPRLWKATQGCVDVFHEYAFANVDGGGHLHRVTLFQWRRFAWWPKDTNGKFHVPWSGWLHPAVRSGHTTQRSPSKFWAPKSRPALAEGVAGHVWSSRRVVNYKDMPILSDSSIDEDFQKYAQISKVPEDWLKQRVKNRKPCARSFVGIPVEIDFDVWGVILLDSQEENLLDTEQVEQSYRLFGGILGKVIPRD